jgi:hypothetical protein
MNRIPAIARRSSQRDTRVPICCTRRSREPRMGRQRAVAVPNSLAPFRPVRRSMPGFVR